MLLMGLKDPGILLPELLGLGYLLVLVYHRIDWILVDVKKLFRETKMG